MALEYVKIKDSVHCAQNGKGVELRYRDYRLQVAGSSANQVVQFLFEVCNGTQLRERMFSTIKPPQSQIFLQNLIAQIQEYGMVQVLAESLPDEDTIDRKEFQMLRFLSDFCAKPKTQLRRFLDARFWLVGEGPMMEALHGTLDAYGVTVTKISNLLAWKRFELNTSESHVLIVAFTDYSLEQTQAWLIDANLRGIPALAVGLYGGSLVSGPIYPCGLSCSLCTAHWLARRPELCTREPDVAAIHYRLFAGHLVFELFKYLCLDVDGDDSDLGNSAFVMDPATMATRWFPMSAHFSCPIHQEPPQMQTFPHRMIWASPATKRRAQPARDVASLTDSVFGVMSSPVQDHLIQIPLKQVKIHLHGLGQAVVGGGETLDEAMSAAYQAGIEVLLRSGDESLLYLFPGIKNIEPNAVNSLCVGVNSHDALARAIRRDKNLRMEHAWSLEWVEKLSVGMLPPGQWNGWWKALTSVLACNVTELVWTQWSATCVSVGVGVKQSLATAHESTKNRFVDTGCSIDEALTRALMRAVLHAQHILHSGLPGDSIHFNVRTFWESESPGGRVEHEDFRESFVGRLFPKSNDVHPWAYCIPAYLGSHTDIP